MTYSIIQKSQLEGAVRLDAEFYQPEYIKYQKLLESYYSASLKDLTTNIDGGYVSSMTSHFREIGIPLIRTQNIEEFTINLNNDLVFIDKDCHSKLKKSPNLSNNPTKHGGNQKNFWSKQKEKLKR